jgi:LysR family transcriptional regulator, transcriptional activator of nhaA
MKRQYNYKHLHYFWAVARAGGISRAAAKLHLTPQTLSGQIKQLEDSLGVALFRTAGKRLELTEAGRVALSYADEIFTLAAELGDALRSLPAGGREPLRVGIGDAVPKSLVHRLLAPLLAGPEAPRLICREAPLEGLLGELALHRLDVVLSSRALPGISVRAYAHLLGESAVGVFAPHALVLPALPFPRCLHGQPMLLPGPDSPLREALLRWLEQVRVVPRVVGEFDDTALMKAFARGGAGCFAAPLAIADEIADSVEAVLVGRLDSVREAYYALSTERRVSHPAVRALIDAAAVTFAGEAGYSKKTDK